MKIKKLILAIVIIVTGVLALSALSPKAQALSGSDFNPGRIIDDSVFFNKDTMSVNDIQNFLYAKSGPCDTNRPTTDSRYQPPWTCLYQYRENTTTKVNNIGSPNSNPAGSITGAQIIYDAAQQYNISPKALIVLIQKESSLITDNWPWSNQYRTATGYGCPDTAPCDSQYYGFYNQVNKAAFQFRRYATYPNEYNYKAGRNNNIGYNPNAGCGSQTVYIQNQATAGLYNYTPYVPNAAALNNLYGTGDGCSAYGNRNFWRLFHDWFGSPTAAPYEWQIVSQTYGGGDAILVNGEKDTLTLTVKNVGTATWTNNGANPVRLATVSPQNRQSGVYDSSWVSPNRAAVLQQTSVAPGENGTFVFKVQAGGTGIAQERFSLVAENTAWFNDPGMYFYLDVRDATWSTQAVSQNLPTSMDSGQTTNTSVVYKNTGNVAWYRDGNSPVRLGVYSPDATTFNDGSWLSAGRPATFAEEVVEPGQNATFNFTLRGPSTGGVYDAVFRPVADNRAWMPPSTSKSITITNNNGTYSWQITSQQYAGGDAILVPGETDTLTVKARNTGTATWRNDGSFPLKLANVAPQNRSSSFYHNTWNSPNRPALLQEASVAPGSIGTFTFTIQASQKGTFQERMSLVAENKAWLNDPGMYFYLDVR